MLKNRGNLSAWLFTFAQRLEVLLGLLAAAVGQTIARERVGRLGGALGHFLFDALVLCFQVDDRNQSVASVANIARSGRTPSLMWQAEVSFNNDTLTCRQGQDVSSQRRDCRIRSLPARHGGGSLTYTGLNYSTLRGVPLDQLPLVFTHQNVDFPGCDAIFGGDCSLYGVPVFENEVIDFNLDLGFSSSEGQTREWVEPMAEQLPPIAAHNAGSTGTDLVGYLTELFGFSSFVRDDGIVYHTYSTTGRGVEFLMGYYPILDRAPKGRDEGEEWQLWIRRHDEYESE